MREQNERPNPKRIALFVTSAFGYTRSAMSGVRQFVRSAPDWVLRRWEPSLESIELMKQWKPDGALVHVYREDLLHAHSALGVPTIGILSDQGGYSVHVDDAGVGQMAAEYLIGRGCQHFAFFGFHDKSESDARQRGFTERLAAGGFAVHPFSRDTKVLAHWLSVGGTPVDPDIQNWLAMLPKPVAIFACDDYWGRELAEACLLAGLSVPRDVAIVGMNNDELICEMSQPTLSSVAIPWERIGHDAAMMLDNALSGRPMPTPLLRIRPTGVVVRQSSEGLAFEDPDVAEAVRFIRRTARQSIDVDDVLQQVNVSRRSLEAKFRRLVGHSPLDEIRATRVDLAKQLLAESDLAIGTVARQSGFASSQRFAVVFRQFAGESPTAYRARFKRR